jgi:ParB family chromosome partitioning protein
VTKRAESDLTRMIPIDKIDPPELAMRETMSDEGLESLAASMREFGQLQAIGVVEHGKRFTVIWGHRRRMAAPRAGLAALEARVYPAGTSELEARKAAENFEQEPINIAAEATYYKKLYDTSAGGDVDKLAAMVRQPVTRVLGRLDLTRGDAEVLQALRDEKINLAVATKLNQCKDEGYRRLFLSDAVRQGATARQVQVWVDDVKRMQRQNEAAAAAGLAPPEAPAYASIASMDACVLCNREGDQHEMEYRKVHASCYRFFRRQHEAPGGEEKKS